jgi:copper chaperone CopZ
MTQPNSLPTQRLTVEGMTCGGCEKSVSRAIEALRIVDVTEVDRQRNHVAVRWKTPADRDGVDAGIRTICEAVEAAGFDCRQTS